MVSPILELTNINKSFGHVQANKNINLKINKGTIHGIIGENGAGKSTLMSIVFGLYQANSGSIKINGQDINLKSPRDSIINGIGMVHQHFMLVENFTVLENIILGFEGETVFGEKLEKAKKDLIKLFDISIYEMLEAIKRGERVELRENFSIEPRIQKARVSRNPKTNEKLNTPEKKSILFKISQEWKKRINEKE